MDGGLIQASELITTKWQSSIAQMHHFLSFHLWYEAYLTLSEVTLISSILNNPA